MSLKLTGKEGKQVKDEGIQYMSFSLGDSNNDYISYVRGKSNVVQVFDVKTDTIFKEYTYDKLGAIKGISPLGADTFALK